MKPKRSAITAGLFVTFTCLLCIASSQLSAAEGDSKSPQYVYVAGEVNVPQRYVFSDGLTLGKAIVMAKGVTSVASETVTLTRQGAEEQTYNLKKIQTGDTKDVKLQPGDKVFVPRKK